ncbi:CopG family ribbon-helix-helix protein [Rhizobium aouanii]|uniref:Ribbon-helix-helix protein, CopG family n=1 Tax=Rhizobium aouanii TaxID=3118145 RepID=A0ABU8CDW0_9HYPH
MAIVIAISYFQELRFPLESGYPTTKLRHEGTGGVPTMTLLSFQMKDSTVSRLDRLAERRKLSSAEIAAVAIEEFIEREEWQLSEIEAAVREAEQSDFASDEDVAAILSKYIGSPSGK